MASSKADIERARRYRRENKNQISMRRAASRRTQITKYGTEQMRIWGLRAHHGPDVGEVVARMLAEQDGCCYLCRLPFGTAIPLIDHDHACCPPLKSCSVCRRGLACNRCNILIGHAADSVDLLRRIADNLERAGAATQARIAAKPQQLELGASAHEERTT